MVKWTVLVDFRAAKGIYYSIVSAAAQWSLNINIDMIEYQTTYQGMKPYTPYNY